MTSGVQRLVSTFFGVIASAGSAEKGLRTPDAEEIEGSPEAARCEPRVAGNLAGGLSDRRAAWKARLQPRLAATQQLAISFASPKSPPTSGGRSLGAVDTTSLAQVSFRYCQIAGVT
jgi:hypothetical protein